MDWRFIRRTSAYLAVTCLTLCACSPRPSSEIDSVQLPENAPNIVLLVLDTVRKDHLSCYGYKRETTPNLDALAESSRIYRNAYSTSSWTIPSHASLFTGQYPIAHNTTKESWKLDEELTTLAEVLSTFGYESMAVVSNPVVPASRKFDQGFTQYHEVWRSKSPQQNTGSIYGDLALGEEELKAKGLLPSEDERAYYQIRASLAERDRSRPFFLFVNLVGAHGPYNSSGPFFDKFLSTSSFDLISTYGSGAKTVVEYYLGRVSYTPEELLHITELYDAEIFHVDFIVGKIIRLFRESALWDNTVFIVTSDHGENFGKNGHILHYFSLYEDTIQVPLLVHYPRRFSPGSEDRGWVQLTDIFPTVLGLLGVPATPFRTQGIDLLSDTPRDKRIIFTEYYRPVDYLYQMNHQAQTDEEKRNAQKYARRIRSIIDGKVKFVWGSDGAHEMYNLDEDPDESYNLLLGHRFERDRIRSLEALLSVVDLYGRPRWKRLRGTSPETAHGELDPETAKALKALGYY